MEKEVVKNPRQVKASITAAKSAPKQKGKPAGKAIAKVVAKAAEAPVVAVAIPVVPEKAKPVKPLKEKKSKRQKFDYELRIDLLGQAIKKARKERKLTQKELGQLVGVKKAQISKLENSLTDARFETIIKVFKALNVKVNFNVELLDQTVTLR